MIFNKNMEIYAKRGQKVIVTKRTAHNGYDSQEQDVAKHLQIGKIYTVEKTEVHSSSTTVQLKEFPNKNWNSVNFIDYVDKPLKDDFHEPAEFNGEPLFCEGAYGFAIRKWKRDNEEQIEARNMYKEGVTKLADSEMIVSSIRAYDRNANGCLRHKKDVMVSYTKEGSKTIYDLFLTRDQALAFHKELGRTIQHCK